MYSTVCQTNCKNVTIPNIMTMLGSTGTSRNKDENYRWSALCPEEKPTYVCAGLITQTNTLSLSHATHASRLHLFAGAAVNGETAARAHPAVIVKVMLPERWDTRVLPLQHCTLQETNIALSAAVNRAAHALNVTHSQSAANT